MLVVLDVTLPVFALVFCGWLAARRGLMGDEAVAGLNAFVFWFALPAMLYRAVSSQPVSRIADPRFIAAWTVAALAIFFATRALSRRGAPDSAQRTGHAFTVAHGNIGYLGLPLLAQLGDPSRLPAMVMAIIVDILVVIVVSIVLFEFARSGRDDAAVEPIGRRIAGAIGGLLRTPLILGIATGLAATLTGLRLPSAVDTFVGLLAQAAGPCALFAIGASLGNRTVRIDRTVTGLMAAKLAAHPVLVAATMWAFGVDPALAAIGVLAAALPSASNTYILAQRYGVDTMPIGAAIVSGTFAAALTVSFVIWVLALPIG
ncbi:MAG TPA: AEC family transporter [Burkholderiaceae bacterium]|nr:AEC family transporter [Burkholderiaceae bacterium]